MDTPSSAQLFYAGEFRHFIDEKNRVTIPARWRRNDSEEFVILPEAKDQFLVVMSPEEFSRMNLAIESDANVSARDRRVFFRQLHARAQHGAADRQGRLVLPANLFNRARLQGEGALARGGGPL